MGEEKRKSGVSHCLLATLFYVMHPTLVVGVFFFPSRKGMNGVAWIWLRLR